MKILILSCNIGEGHNSASKAIKEEFDVMGIECEIRDTLSFASEKISRFVSDTYVKMVINTPEIWGKMYEAGKKYPANKRYKSPVYFSCGLFAEKVSRYINNEGYDAVIMTHLYPGEVLTYLKRRGKIDKRLYFVSTDYSPCPLLEECDADRFFIPHKDLAEDYIDRGIDGDRLVATGIPVSRRFNNRLSKEEARKRLGLPVDRKIALIMSGSMGYGNLRSTSDQLYREDPDVIQLILGGNNEEMKEKLRKDTLGNDSIRILDYTTDVPMFMDACDVLFTKPGGLTSTEACVKNIPMIHTDPIPGNEMENIDFFTAHGLSVYKENISESVREAVNLLNNREAAVKMIKAQDNEINADAAKDIADTVVRDLTKGN